MVRNTLHIMIVFGIFKPSEVVNKLQHFLHSLDQHSHILSVTPIPYRGITHRSKGLPFPDMLSLSLLRLRLG